MKEIADRYNLQLLLTWHSQIDYLKTVYTWIQWTYSSMLFAVLSLLDSHTTVPLNHPALSSIFVQKLQKLCAQLRQRFPAREKPRFIWNSQQCPLIVSETHPLSFPSSVLCRLAFLISAIRSLGRSWLNVSLLADFITASVAVSSAFSFFCVLFSSDFLQFVLCCELYCDGASELKSPSQSFLPWLDDPNSTELFRFRNPCGGFRDGCYSSAFCFSWKSGFL